MACGEWGGGGVGGELCVVVVCVGVYMYCWMDACMCVCALLVHWHGDLFVRRMDGCVARIMVTRIRWLPANTLLIGLRQVFMCLSSNTSHHITNTMNQHTRTGTQHSVSIITNARTPLHTYSGVGVLLHAFTFYNYGARWHMV